MLVLTRRLNETIVIGGGITVTLLAVQGNRVRIGVNAPKDIQINREELCGRQVEFVGQYEDA